MGPVETATPAASTDADADFPIVGIGSSAGGLEAIEALLRRLSSDGMAYVVLQHLAPSHESLLAEILARATQLQVVTVENGAEVVPNHIYVAPPGVELSITRGVLYTSPASEQVPRYSIDVFFRSLAEDRKTAAIGVILSGAGSDGTQGLRAIAAAGGITFAQEPQSASHGSMPQSAIDMGCVDFCLVPSEIGDELMRLSAHPFVARKRPPRLLGKDTRSRIFSRLLRIFGVDFAAYKWSTIDRRIARRMALQNIEHEEDYARLIESSPEEVKVLYGDLLIGVTSFFRDHEVFDALKTLIFPKILENRSPESPVRIWVPATATGEEAYSLAICLLEFLGERRRHQKIQIFATDIDDVALNRARLAVYPVDIEVDVSPDRLQRFFARHEKGYRVSQQVRDLVIFAHHNLGKDPPFSRLDLVSCRNLLIYMQPPLQRKILRIFHYALGLAGFLVLGTSESVGDGSDLFQLIDRKLKIYKRKEAASSAVFDFAFGARGALESHPVSMPHASAPVRQPLNLQQMADRTTIERYGPPGVVINENLDVVQFRGRTGSILDPRPGSATLNILQLVRPELLIVLRTAIQRAWDEGIPVVTKAVQLPDGPGQPITIDVVPLTELDAGKKGLLVSFREIHPNPEELPTPEAEAEPTSAARIKILEQELILTREYLQSSIQDLQAANEELQSSNEELQSTNEELQSTNEELETSKEELQSTNEELSTVNEELQNRMGQLAVSNEDLENLMTHISAPVVIIGTDLRIRRFSAAAEKLLNLIAADLGRPVAALGVSMKTRVDESTAEAIRSGSVREQQVRCADGRDYLLRISPYLGNNQQVRGGILEFLPLLEGRS